MPRATPGYSKGSPQAFGDPPQDSPSSAPSFNLLLLPDQPLGTRRGQGRVAAGLWGLGSPGGPGERLEGKKASLEKRVCKLFVFEHQAKREVLLIIPFVGGLISVLQRRKLTSGSFNNVPEVTQCK